MFLCRVLTAKARKSIRQTPDLQWHQRWKDPPKEEPCLLQGPALGLQSYRLSRAAGSWALCEVLTV